MKNYLAWLGNNATYGNPHPVTGRLSMYGELYAFDSKADRDQFCNTYSNRYNAYPAATNRQQAKAKYCAGMTQQNFDDYLSCIISGMGY